MTVCFLLQFLFIPIAQILENSLENLTVIFRRLSGLFQEIKIFSQTSQESFSKFPSYLLGIFSDDDQEILNAYSDGGDSRVI